MKINFVLHHDFALLLSRKSFGECSTILTAYTLYRQLG